MISFFKNLLSTMSDSILMSVKHPELFFLLIVHSYFIIPYIRDIHPFLVPMVLAITLVGIDIYFMGNIFTYFKEISQVLRLYILRYIMAILVMIFTIYPFVTHYAWVSLYYFFKLFGKILYSEDYIIVDLLMVIFCLFICDFIAKWILFRKKNKIIHDILWYCLGFLILFMLFSLSVFFTFTRSFSQFEIFKIPVIFFVDLQLCSLLIWQRLYCFSLNDFVSIDKKLFSFS